MRTLPLSSLLLCFACALPAEDAVPAPKPAPVTPTPTVAPTPTPTPTPAVTPAPVATDTTPPATEPPVPVVEARPDGRFMLEFRGARLGQVLDYLSAVAGYVIANPVELPTPLTLVAKQPVTPQEAVDALNSVLIAQNYAVIVRQKTLHVVPLATARQHNLPVFIGSDPARIPDTDQMVTQVMPVQFALVKDLADNLQPLLNVQSATLAANESSNVLILTDTQAHIKRIAAIIQAIDRAVGGEQAVKVFTLAHADAEKVAQIINSLYGSQSTQTRGGNQGQQFNRNRGNNQQQQQTQGGREIEVQAAADSGTNSLVVRASPETLVLLGDVVLQLDRDNSARDDVLLYRVRNGKAADLATSLNELFQGIQASTSSTQTRTAGQTGARGTTVTTQPAPATRVVTAVTASGANANSGDAGLDLSGQVRVVADAVSNSVMVLSPERNFDRIRRLLEQLDQPVKQVLVRVLVAEVTLERGLDLGVELTGGSKNSTTASNVFTDFNLFDSALGVNGFLIENTDFRAAIRALATNTKFDVLSRPYILTTDNREATVNVSQEVPVISGSRTDLNNNVTSTFDRRDVGIILTVTPQINSEGLVVLDVTQELSALSDQAIPVAADVESPIINKRTMTTRVLVEHGQTAVIGGLVTDQVAQTVRKVPLLGDIPLLGALFRRTESTKSQIELLVFLTPQVVKNPQELADLSRQLRGEMQRLDAAVEKGLLQQHLEQLGKTRAAATPTTGAGNGK
ncbi:MAG: type II secretion system secretin GspD [Planctomycetes bacterium]|nr:type II secretion system secretin GspD [Planctomycetota bacterium]